MPRNYTKLLAIVVGSSALVAGCPDDTPSATTGDSESTTSEDTESGPTSMQPSTSASGTMTASSTSPSTTADTDTTGPGDTTIGAVEDTSTSDPPPDSSSSSTAEPPDTDSGVSLSTDPTSITATSVFTTGAFTSGFATDFVYTTGGFYDTGATEGWTTGFAGGSTFGFSSTGDEIDGQCPEDDLGSMIGLDVAEGLSGQGNDTNISCAGGGADDVTFTWTAPEDGSYSINLLGSSYDSALAVFDQCPPGQTQLNCRDDTFGLTAGINLCDVSADDAFIIAVEGFSGATGNFDLNILLREADTDCCDDQSGTGITGCEVPDIQDCVCRWAPGCCNVEWNEYCASWANFCGADCGWCAETPF